ncbi:MAG: helix-turn-helix domain-containing protein [Isosphaeraceae bacterium]|nr:helix-turn-helix domain-containing protein [Isosphaeraceae bacterium]
MNMKIDPTTRFVSAEKVKIFQPRSAEPIDLSRDTLLLLDPLTHRPIAICRPLSTTKVAPTGALAFPTATTAAATAAADCPVALTEAAPSCAPAPKVEPPQDGRFVGPRPIARTDQPVSGTRRPLSEAQREWIQRHWLEHPDWPAGRIARLFEEFFGRCISEQTVEKYKPLNGFGKPQ